MSEFKYACPVCGQHIKCDSSQAGAVMTCPTCFQKITVPQAPATEDQKFILTGTKVGERPVVKFSDAAPVAPPHRGFPGAIAVIIILAFIGVTVAAIYFETIFKKAPPRPPPAPVAVATNVEPRENPDFAAPPGGVNLALRMTSFASTEENQRPAANGNDGDIHTRWCASSASVPQWWAVDLGNTATITNTQIIWEHNAAYRYVIETSTNNSDWAVVADQSANRHHARVTSDIFTAHARFLRVVVTGLPRNSWASFYEFRAFGSFTGDDK